MFITPKNEAKRNVNVTKFLVKGENENEPKYFYTPEDDEVFRTIFGASGREKATKSFVESIFGTNIGTISLRTNPEFRKNYKINKKQTVDVKAICENGNILIIEMQNRYTPDALKRFSTYAEKAHLENLSKKMKYGDLPKVMLIVIMAENIPKFKDDKSYYHIFNDRDKFCPDNIFCDDVTKYVIELPKYIEMKEKAKLEERKTIINPWLEFLINPLGEEVSREMRTNEELREAVELLRKLNRDEEVYEIYEAEEWDRYERESERAACIYMGREEGRAEGIATGRAEAEKETITNVILNMNKKEIPIEVISQVTQMSIEEIKEILESEELVS